MIGEKLAAVVFLGELVALGHRAHRAVQDEDALAKEADDRVPGESGMHRSGEGVSQHGSRGR